MSGTARLPGFDVTGVGGGDGEQAPVPEALVPAQSLDPLFAACHVGPERMITLGLGKEIALRSLGRSPRRLDSHRRSFKGDLTPIPVPPSM